MFLSKNFIYGLWESGTHGEIRYVGKTTMGARRFYGHRSDRTRTHRGSWLRSLSDRGKDFRVIVLERCDKALLAERERHWIAWCRAQGFRLVNATDGGEGPLGRVWTKEMRAKNSLSNRGKRRSADTIERSRNAQKLVWQRPGYREKMSRSHLGNACHLGYQHSGKAKTQISAVRRATMKTEPHRVLRGERCAGAKLTAGDVVAIRAAVAAGESQHSLALRFRVGDAQVSYIVHRKSWSHVP